MKKQLFDRCVNVWNEYGHENGTKVYNVVVK